MAESLSRQRLENFGRDLVGRVPKEVICPAFVGLTIFSTGFINVEPGRLVPRLITSASLAVIGAGIVVSCELRERNFRNPNP